jgi:hypothetical protein
MILPALGRILRAGGRPDSKVVARPDIGLRLSLPGET